MFGETFRKIRISRGMSIEYLADQNISKSTISRFERSEADITLVKFISLLDKVKISLQEFVAFLPAYPSNTSSLNELPKAVLNNDISSLEKLIETESGILARTNNLYSKLTLIVLELHHKELSGKKIDYDEKLGFLVDYLFQNDIWSQFDTVIFANTISYLPIETVISLSNEIARKASKNQMDRSHFETIINTLQNAAFVCLEHGQISEAEEFIRIIEELEMDETYFLENIILLFIRGICLIKLGKNSEGKEMVNNSLLAMRLSGALTFEDKFDQYYKKLVSE